MRDALPERVRRLRHQWLGTVSAGCAATWGIHERCDFSCTACYLSESANQSQPLEFDDVRRQLDTILRLKGPGANTQVTSGEVTLLPREELARIIRYAKALPLDPMLMTHGQSFDRDVTYLPYLMREAGLEKVAIHVDLSQRGRDGFRRPHSEAELAPVRDRMADTIRRARRETGLPLHAAHTVTVVPENLAAVGGILRWVMENADAFRMVSFHPVADVGRTRSATNENALERVWQELERGAGIPLNARSFLMGHPSCHAQSLSWVVKYGSHTELVEVHREGVARDAAFMDSLTGGPLRGFTIDDATPAEAVGRLLGLLKTHPEMLCGWPLFALYRLFGGQLGLAGRVATAFLRGEQVSIQPLVIVVHAFMAAADLETPAGRERLAACTFKVPVGEAMISMCEMNATDTRRRLVDALIPASALVR